MIRLSAVLLLSVATFSLGVACSTQTQESEAVVTFNSKCPGMGEDVDPAGETYDWNGKTIGFCCEGCLPKFAKLSDVEKTAALAKAEAGG